MDKKLIVENAKKYFNGKLLEIVLEQIENYFKLYNSDYLVKNNYQIGDEVILNEKHLLHGIGNHIDLINIFSERGVVSPDFFGNNLNHAFCYNSAFWKVTNPISLGKYIKNYSGAVVKFNKQYHQIPYGELDKFVESIRNVDHWSWTAESSMEIRFMPSLARDVNQIALIFNTENEICTKMRENSVFDKKINFEDALKFVGANAIDKYREKGFTDDFFERSQYLIFGLPSCCIEGILVGRKIENNKNDINLLKKNVQELLYL